MTICENLKEVKNVIIDAMLHRKQKVIYQTLSHYTNSDYIGILIHDEESEKLYDINTDRVFQVDELSTNSILGLAFHQRKTKLYKHIMSEKLFIPEIDNPYDIKLRSQILMPILDDECLLGIIRLSKSICNQRLYTPYTLKDLQELHPIFVKLLKQLRDKNDTQPLQPLASSEENTIEQDLQTINKLMQRVSKQSTNVTIQELIEESLNSLHIISKRYHGLLIEDQSDPSLGSLQSFNILIVDDTKLNTSILKALLEHTGYPIEVAYDGDEALKRMQAMHTNEQSIDIVFLDHHMPKMLGSQVAEEITSNPTTYHSSKPYIVSITNDPEAIMDKHDLYDFHIRKPFMKMEIQEVVEKIKKSIA